MVTIKVFTGNSDNNCRYYTALSRTEAVSILLTSGFLDDQGQWTRRGEQHAEITVYNPIIDSQRVWNIP